MQLLNVRTYTFLLTLSKTSSLSRGLQTQSEHYMSDSVSLNIVSLVSCFESDQLKYGVLTLPITFYCIFQRITRTNEKQVKTTEKPERIPACGIDTIAVANFIRFLKNFVLRTSRQNLTISPPSNVDSLSVTI